MTYLIPLSLGNIDNRAGESDSISESLVQICFNSFVLWGNAKLGLSSLKRTMQIVQKYLIFDTFCFLPISSSFARQKVLVDPDLA